MGLIRGIAELISVRVEMAAEFNESPSRASKQVGKRRGEEELGRGEEQRNRKDERRSMAPSRSRS